VTIALERPVGTTDPITLVDPDVADRLTRRITTDHPDIDKATALRIIGQAAAFIAASGQQPGQSLAPSKLVDYGWHAFILHTVDYARFCEQAVGRFVHHVPTDEDAIEAAGYTVDHELWGSAADCNQCHAGCTDSPNT
jgi:hypothetical protein